MKRPFNVALLAALSALAGAIAIYQTLQFLHLSILGAIPNPGTYRFFALDQLGAVLWGGLACGWAWTAWVVWRLRRGAWQLVAALAGLSLAIAFTALVGGSGVQAMLPEILLNGIMLIYAFLPGTRSALSGAAAG